MAFTEVYIASGYPQEFLFTRKDWELVHTVINKNYRSAPEQLRTLGTNPGQTLQLKAPSLALSLYLDHPPYFLLRFDSVLTTKLQNNILAAWDYMQHPSRRPVIRIKHAAERSGTPAIHLGAWELYKTTPDLTRETREQSIETLKAMDSLLKIFHSVVAMKINNLMKRYCPRLYCIQQK